MSDNARLSFEHLVPNGWYGSMSYYDGYGGFNFEDMQLVTRAWVHQFGNDSGFKNVLHGGAEICTDGVNQVTLSVGYGWIVSPSPSQTFDFKSGIFAGAVQGVDAIFYAFMPAAKRSARWLST